MSRRRRIGIALLSGLLASAALITLVAGFMLGTESGSRKAVQISLAYLTRSAGIEASVDVSSGTLLQGLQLKNLRYRNAAAKEELNIAQLEFEWQPLKLLQNQLTLTDLQVKDLLWQSQSDPSAADEALSSDDIGQWFGLVPFALQVDQAQGTNLAISIDDSVSTIPHLRFSGSLNEHLLQLNSLEAEYADLALQGQASVQSDLLVTADLAWSYKAAYEFSGQLNLHGDLLHLQVEHHLLAPIPVHSAGMLTTGLSGTEALAAALEHDAAAINLAVFDLPEINLNATSISTNGTLETLSMVGKSGLQAYDFAPAEINFSSRYTPENIEINSVVISSDQIDAQVTGGYELANQTLMLDWVLSRITLQDFFSGMQLNDVSGNGHLLLNADASGVDATVELGPLQGELNGFPLALRGSLQVNDSALTSIDLTANNDDNSLQASGLVAPDLALSWQFNAPRLQQLWTGLSGTIAGQGELTGSTSTPLISGQLEGQALALNMDGTVYNLRNFKAEAATAADTNKVQLELQGFGIENAGELFEVLDKGRLQLSGTRQAQQLTADLQGLNSNLQLSLNGNLDQSSWSGELASAQLQSDYGAWILQKPLALSVSQSGFDISQHCWAMQQVLLCGKASQVAGSGLSAQLKLSDLPLSWFNTLAKSPDKPAALQYWQNTLDLNLPQGLEVSGSADVLAEVSGLAAEGWKNLQVDIQPHDLAFLLTRQIESETQTLEPEIQRINFNDVALSLNNRNEIWSSNSAFVVSSPDSGSALQGKFSADLSMNKTEELSGNVALNFDDLAWLETIVPQLRLTRGALHGSAQISGSMTAPLINAELGVSGGSFMIPDYGLDVHDVSVRLTSSGDQAQLAVSATSGEGVIQLQATVLQPAKPEREVSATIKGKDFALITTEAATVTVSPDLEASLSTAGLVVGGSLEVPVAKLELEALLADAATGGVNPSRDVVILKPDPEAMVASQTQVLPLSARLTLALGDAVSVSGFGLEANLNGELMLEQDVNHPLLAYGELGIPSGSYRFYNQQLSARDGRLLFYGNPFNPVLDVKAFRKTSTAEVGLQLSGGLNNIQGTLYSTPSLPENEILAMLITGKSFNKMNDQDGGALISAIANLGIERGEGITSKIGDTLGLDNLAVSSGENYQNSSLGLGKYLTPDLLMRYEIGLFDRQAVLSIYYTLSEHFKLEVKTGLSQSVDISYTIEKD